MSRDEIDWGDAPLIEAIRFDFADGTYFDVDRRIEIEAEMLTLAGVTTKDYEFAWRRWITAGRVRDDWPFMRTVMWGRAVERAELRAEVTL